MKRSEEERARIRDYVVGMRASLLRIESAVGKVSDGGPALSELAKRIGHSALDLGIALARLEACLRTEAEQDERDADARGDALDRGD